MGDVGATSELNIQRAVRIFLDPRSKGREQSEEGTDVVGREGVGIGRDGVNRKSSELKSEPNGSDKEEIK